MTEKEYNTSVDLHAKSLFRFIFKNLNVREDAENIVQDSFESLWLNKDKVEFSKSKSWLFTTGYRKMIDSIRKNKKIVEMPEFIKEKGNIINDTLKGDIKIFIKIENDSGFERQGLNLLIKKNISIKESLCGFTFEMKHLNGKTYTLHNNVGNIIPPDFKKIIQRFS